MAYSSFSHNGSLHYTILLNRPHGEYLRFCVIYHYLLNIIMFIGHLGSFQLFIMIINAAIDAFIHFTFGAFTPGALDILIVLSSCSLSGEFYLNIDF